MKNTKKVNTRQPATPPRREKVNVGVSIYKDELDEMRKVTRVDLNGPAVLSLARKGLAYEKEAALNKAQ